VRRAERIVIVGGRLGREVVAAYRRAGGRGNVLLIGAGDEPVDGAEPVLDAPVALDADAGWVEISEGVRLHYDRLLLADPDVGVPLARGAGLLLAPDGSAVAVDARLRTTGDRVLALRSGADVEVAGAELARRTGR
jgi:NADPH-dependent 2,4-dienoyl-CoA reductase/sulfur reductase-like enzyme